jgi:hypothetical protein
MEIVTIACYCVRSQGGSRTLKTVDYATGLLEDDTFGKLNAIHRLCEKEGQMLLSWIGIVPLASQPSSHTIDSFHRRFA